MNQIIETALFMAAAGLLVFFVQYRRKRKA